MKQLVVAALFGFALCSSAAQAQEWPSGPVTVVVPFAPGGSTDITARILSNQLAEATGQPFLVENRPGGGGAVGATSVARAPGDGNTLLFGSSGTFAVNQHLYPNLEYDMERDFAPISQITQNRHVVFVGAGSDIETIEELFERMRAEPETITYSSAGIGSGTHLAVEAILAAAELKGVHVPYASAGAGNLAVTAGEVDFGVDAIGSTLSFFKSGQLRPLAVTTIEHEPLLAEVPTLDETVLPGFANEGWLAMVAPIATPPETLARISEVVLATMDDPATKELFAQQGLIPAPSTPAELATKIETDSAAYGELIRSAGIVAQ